METSTQKPKLRASTWGRLHRKPPPVGIAEPNADGDEVPAEALPSIDAIISRTRPVVDRSFNRQRSELLAREEAIETAEQGLDARRRELRELELQLHEKERELLEWDRLVEIRERALSKREHGLLTTGGGEHPPLGTEGTDETEQEHLAAAQAALQRREEELRILAERCARRARELDRREAELTARFSGPLLATPTDSPSENTLRDWEHQLAQKEAMLKEREAFVEKSENVLFERAQELQILETELEHCLAGADDAH